MSPHANRPAMLGDDELPHCACGEPLETPYERRHDKCYECERLDERMLCVVCQSYVGIAYCDGSPTFCSDQCEDDYWQ